MTGLEHLDGDPFQTNIVLGEEEARYCVSRRGYTTSEASISSRAVANAVASISLEQDEVVEARSRQPHVRVSENLPQTIYLGDATDEHRNEFLQLQPDDPGYQVKLAELIPADDAAWPHGLLTALGSSELHSGCLIFSGGTNVSLTDDETEEDVRKAWLIESLIPDAYWVDRRLKRNGSVSGLRTTVDSPDAASLLTRYRPAYWDRKNRLSIASAWASEFYKTYTGTFPAIDPDQVASAFALALSDVNYTTNTKPYDLLLKDSIEPGENPNNTRTLKQYLTEHDVWSQYNSIELFASASESVDPSSTYQLSISKYVTGYAYSSSGTTVRVSIAVIGLYALITIPYLVYSLTTGITATSWDIIGELVMLALNSKRPEHLKHVSAGIERLKTFREPVSIRVNDENSLELVFEDDPAYKALNRKYRRLNFNEKF